jgi:hypothetical protein
MLLRFFRSTNAQIVFLIPIIGILLWLPAILFKNTNFISFSDATPTPLWHFLTGWMNVKSIGAIAFALLLLILQAFWLVRLNTKFILVNNRTYMPALFFIIFASFIPEVQYLSATIPAGILVLFATEKIIHSHSESRIAVDIFQASFLIGLGSLIYPNLVFFIPAMFIGLSIMRNFRWREWLFVILGFLTPLLLTSCYYYLVYDKPFELLSASKLIFISTHKPIDISVFTQSSMAVLLGLTVFASQYLLKSLQTQKVLPRKTFTLFFWLFATTLLMFFFVPKTSYELMYFIAFPLSFLFTYYFSNSKANRFLSILLYILTFTVISLRFF